MQQYKKNLGKVSLTAEGKWNIKNAYPILSIVYDEHTQHGFISKKDVPENIDLNNNEYWMPLNVSGYADNNIIILSEKTSENTIKDYTLKEAVQEIASVGRKPGAILCFYNANTDRLDIGGRWEIWQFNSTTISEWENVESWQNIYYNYNKFVGWYKDENMLKQYNPFPEIGCYAFVGTKLNEATIYRCENKYIWTDTTQHSWDYIKIIVEGNVTVGENGNWFNNGVDTNIPASVKGENGKTPVFRNNNNVIEVSYDNVEWNAISDEIAAWFRWQSEGGQQANSAGKIQITRDGITWTDLSGQFVNNLRISRYIGVDESLPTSNIVEGTIYAKGPYYEDDDANHNYPAYRIWVYAWKGNTLAWVDNGQFTSIVAGIVQETGDSENAVMSQKAVTEKLSELGSEVSGLDMGIRKITGSNEHIELKIGKAMSGYYRPSDGRVTETSSDGVKYSVVDLSAYVGLNVTFELIGGGSSGGRYIMMADAEQNVNANQSANESNIAASGGSKTWLITESYPYAYLSCSNGCSYIVTANANIKGELPVIKENLERTEKDVQKISSDLTEIENDLMSILGTGEGLNISLGDSKSGYYKISDGKVVETNSDGEKFEVLDLSKFVGAYIKFELIGSGSSVGRYVVFADVDKNVNPEQYINENGIVTSGGYKNWLITEKYHYAYFSCSSGNSFKITINGEGEIANIKKRLNILENAVYVSPRGDDNNDGSFDKPLKTINKALELGLQVFLFGGIFEQTIDLSRAKTKEIIIGSFDRNEKSVIVDSGRIISTNESLVVGTNRVYSVLTNKTFVADNKWIYQDGVPYIEILQPNRHPLHKGKTHYYNDTRIARTSANTLDEAINEIEKTTNSFRWFYDSSSSTLYFSRPRAITQENPLCMSNGNTLFKNCNGHRIVMSGIESKYLVFNIDDSINSLITDCVSTNVYGAGSFTYNRCLNSTFVRCEASTCCTGANGDGFNGHAREPFTSNNIEKNVTNTCIDCWSHHNNDDGISDHGKCESTIIGGLYEYNRKGGLVPAYGAHWTVYNVMSRNNYCGFLITGTPETNEGGVGTQMICYGCVSESNNDAGRKSGFHVEGESNSMVLVNCKSVNNVNAYVAKDANTLITMYDCTSVGHTELKSGDGSFNIKNTNLVE